MDADWPARVAAARQAPALRHAPKLGSMLLALAGCGQAVVQSVALAAPGGGPGPQAGTASLAVEYTLPLCLLALLATVPLAIYRPATALVVITFGNAVALASFGLVTVAGAAAELIAAWLLGHAGAGPAGGAPASGPGSAPASGPGGAPDGSRGMAGRYLAVGIAVPFLVLAVSGRGGTASVLLASGAPIAGGAGIAAWAGRQARTGTAAGQALADTLLAHTARGERARIARELHDVVAHHISMIAVQAETGRLTTPALPEAGARRFAEIGDTARAGLTEMRRLLGVLRDDAAQAVPGETAGRRPQPGLAQLTELIAAARESSATGTRLIISGPVAPLDTGVELAAYRIVQEALTNARRHAPGAAVDVELRYSPGALWLRVRDNGPGPATADGGGHGLPGMRERALSAGGSLRTGAAPGGGFFVEAVLPAPPGHAPAAAAAVALGPRGQA